jgi:hypothetical protein
MDGSTALQKCCCGTHTLTPRESADLPRDAWGIVYCFQSCIKMHAASWRSQQQRLGFDLTVGAVEDIDIAELAGA